MLLHMDKGAILKLKKKGLSNRKVARITGTDRKTVAKYWRLHCDDLSLLEEDNLSLEEVQERIINTPKYNSSNRLPRKYNADIDLYINMILQAEDKKNQILGRNKQGLTQLQIYQMVREKGFDIGLTTIANVVRKKRKFIKECFIKQEYDYGDRLEYDFGEVKLVINGAVSTYYLAVLSSPASNYRWAYLYRSANKEAFMDSHVRFFEMVKGVYKEVVYDNMKNVVSKFIGKSEKVLNEDLIKMSIYYGFEINVTNCYSGNEKGHVESSVKYIRNKIFSKAFKFNDEEEAKDYLANQLTLVNIDSEIKKEKEELLPYRPKLELAKISNNLVNKYSFVRIDNNFYSVPDYLVGKEVIIHKYIDKIKIFSNNKEVAAHKKIDGYNLVSIDIKHYLTTFLKKPGALKNSSALKSMPRLKHIYDSYFTSNPKYFIELLNKHKEKELDDLINELAIIAKAKDFNCINQVSNTLDEKINIQTRSQISALKNIYKIN